MFFQNRRAFIIAISLYYSKRNCIQYASFLDRVGKNRDSRNKRRSEQRRSFLAEAFFLSQPISFCRLDTSSPHFRRVHERKGRRDNGSRNSRRWRKTGREIEGASAQKLDLTGTVEEKLPRNSHETKRNGTKALGYFFQRLEEKMEGERVRERKGEEEKKKPVFRVPFVNEMPLCARFDSPRLKKSRRYPL